LDALVREEALLIDPATDNPAEFISFREEYAFACEDNLRGRTTIEILKLNDRPDLIERRREKIRTLRLIRHIVTLMPQSQEALDARQYLHDAMMDTGEYAAMTRMFLQ
jgi:hypothetical protein